MILLFWDVVSAQGTQTWYTDFYVVGGVNWVSNLSTSWHEWEFEFVMANHSLEPISGNIYFVDAIEISSGVYACLSNTEIKVFWQYLSWDQNFQLNPEEIFTWTVSYNFPDSYSWVYNGCILYSISDGDSVINMSSRKAYFLNISLSAKDVEVHMIANLWSRWNANTSNNNWYESKWKMLFYSPWDHNDPLYSWYVIMDSEWYWVLSWVQVMAWCYDVVYKWWHHLSSFITNVCIHEWEEINFVTNSNLWWVWIFDETLPYNGWLAYQIAWDMPTSNNNYDNQINWTDLSVLYWSNCPYMQTPGKWHVCDLNNDGRVDSSDASAILANLWKKDLAYCGFNNEPQCEAPQFWWFGTVIYFWQ